MKLKEKVNINIRKVLTKEKNGESFITNQLGRNVSGQWFNQNCICFMKP
jgi:hypothetical protein